MKSKITIGKLKIELEIDNDGSLKIEFLDGEDYCLLDIISNSYCNEFSLFYWISWLTKSCFYLKVNDTQLWVELEPWFLLDYCPRFRLQLQLLKFKSLTYFPRRQKV